MASSSSPLARKEEDQQPPSLPVRVAATSSHPLLPQPPPSSSDPVRSSTAGGTTPIAAGSGGTSSSSRSPPPSKRTKRTPKDPPASHTPKRPPDGHHDHPKKPEEKAASTCVPSLSLASSSSPVEQLGTARWPSTTSPPASTPPVHTAASTTASWPEVWSAVVDTWWPQESTRTTTTVTTTTTTTTTVTHHDEPTDGRPAATRGEHRRSLSDPPLPPLLSPPESAPPPEAWPGGWWQREAATWLVVRLLQAYFLATTTTTTSPDRRSSSGPTRVAHPSSTRVVSPRVAATLEQVVHDWIQVAAASAAVSEDPAPTTTPEAATTTATTIPETATTTVAHPEGPLPFQVVGVARAVAAHFSVVPRPSPEKAGTTAGHLEALRQVTSLLQHLAEQQAQQPKDGGGVIDGDAGPAAPLGPWLEETITLFIPPTPSTTGHAPHPPPPTGSTVTVPLLAWDIYQFLGDAARAIEIQTIQAVQAYHDFVILYRDITRDDPDWYTQWRKYVSREEEEEAGLSESNPFFHEASRQLTAYLQPQSPILLFDLVWKLSCMWVAGNNTDPLWARNRGTSEARPATAVPRRQRLLAAAATLGCMVALQRLGPWWSPSSSSADVAPESSGKALGPAAARSKRALPDAPPLGPTAAKKARPSVLEPPSALVEIARVSPSSVPSSSSPPPPPPMGGRDEVDLFVTALTATCRQIMTIWGEPLVEKEFLTKNLLQVEIMKMTHAFAHLVGRFPNPCDNNSQPLREQLLVTLYPDAPHVGWQLLVAALRTGLTPRPSVSRLGSAGNETLFRPDQVPYVHFERMAEYKVLDIFISAHEINQPSAPGLAKKAEGVVVTAVDKSIVTEPPKTLPVAPHETLPVRGREKTTEAAITPSTKAPDDRESVLVEPTEAAAAPLEQTCPTPIPVVASDEEKIEQLLSFRVTDGEAAKMIRRAVTPPIITEAMELTEWTVALLSLAPVKPSRKLKKYLEEGCEGQPLTWHQVLLPVLNRSLLMLANESIREKPTRVVPISFSSGSEKGVVEVVGEMTADKQLCKGVVALFYHALEAVLICESARLSTEIHPTIVVNDVFHQALLSCCCVCVTKAVGVTYKLRPSPSLQSLQFYSILTSTESSPYDFLKVSESFLRSLTMEAARDKLESPLVFGLPRLLQKEIKRVEVDTIDSLLWSRDVNVPYSLADRIDEFLEKSQKKKGVTYWPPESLAPTLEEEIEDLDGELSLHYPRQNNEDYAEYRCISFLVKKLLNIAHHRISALCRSLSVPSKLPIVTLVFTAFRRVIRNHIELLYDRHVDHWILCSLYGVLKTVRYSPEITFARIINAYVELRAPEMGEITCQRNVRQIKIESVKGGADTTDNNIIELYNRVFVPHMKDYLLTSRSLNRAKVEVPRLLETNTGIGQDSRVEHQSAGLVSSRQSEIPKVSGSNKLAQTLIQFGRPQSKALDQANEISGEKHLS